MACHIFTMGSCIIKGEETKKRTPETFETFKIQDVETYEAGTLHRGWS